VQAHVGADVVNVGLVVADPVFEDGSPIPGAFPVSAGDDADTRTAFFMVRKEDSPDPVGRGQALSYVLWIANPSPNPILDLVVTERYPPGFSFASAAPAPTEGSNVWALGSLAPGGLIPIVISGNVTAQTPAGSVLTNTVTVDSSNGGSITARETTRVTAPDRPGRTEIRLTKSDDRDPVAPGSELTYTIRVENYGPVTATNVVVTEAYDPLFAYENSSPEPKTGTSNVWQLGKMEANTVKEITVRGRVFSQALNGYVLLNEAVAKSRNADPSSDAELTLVGDSRGPEILKTASPEPVLGSQALIYTVTVANVSQAVIPDVSVIESYDPFFAYQSSAPAPLAGSSNVWFLGDLAPGETTNIVITGIVLKKCLAEDILFTTAEAVSPLGSRTVHLATRVVNPRATPVSLLYFRAEDAPGGVKLVWKTATERENLGFNVYRSAAPSGKRVRVNASLVPASTTSDGKRYACLDATAVAGRTYYYWLEEVSWNYMTKVYGPARRAGTGPSGERPAGGLGTFTATAKGGLYRIRYEALAESGIPAGSLNADTVAVTLGGNPLPLYVNARGETLQPGDFILLYVPPSPEGVELSLTALAPPARMALAEARPLRGQGDVYVDSARPSGKLRFATDPGFRRYFLFGFESAPVWVVDVTETTNTVLLYGGSCVTLTNGQTGVYLSYGRDDGPAACLAVQDEAVKDVPRLTAP
jgi:uncharacterized repeat protein (TIGR01451 family)